MDFINTNFNFRTPDNNNGMDSIFRPIANVGHRHSTPFFASSPMSVPSASTSTGRSGYFSDYGGDCRRSDLQTFNYTHSSKSGTSKSINNILSPASSSTTKSNNSVMGTTIMAIVEGRGLARGEVGIACMDLNTPNVILCQFADSQTYTKLITKINIFRPFEILLPSTSCEGTGTQMYKQLHKEISYSTIIPIQRRLFNEANGLRTIQSLVAEEFGSIVRLVSHKYYCVAAAAALLKYADLLHNIIFAPKSLKIEFQVSEKCCLIDTATAQHLELLINNQHQNSTHSLFGVINTCRTPLGTRLLRINMLQPPCDVALITKRLDCVDELMKNANLIFGLQKSLNRLPVDLEQVIATLVQIPKMYNEKILEQRINYIIGLKHTLELLPLFLSDLQTVENVYLKTLRDAFDKPVHKTILNEIKNVLHEEAQVQRGAANMKRQRCFAIQSGHNGLLDIARHAYSNIIDDMNDYVKELGEQNNMSLRLMENSNRGYYIQYTRGETVPQMPPEFLRVKTQRNLVTFTTETLLTFDQRCREITKEIQNISSVILTELIAKIRGHIGHLYHVSEAVANLDLLVSLANYSLMLGNRGTRPKFCKEMTSITNGRHPILDFISLNPIVPNNAFFSQDTNFMLLTGPNMSGKTTYLKQMATLQILAQLGCYIPAEAATVRMANSLFSRIGTGDDLENNASTFSLEMTEMDYILRNLSDTSLVIIDELGRGTSTEEGTGVAWALAEALMKTTAFIVFATHYLYLTKMESLYLNIINYKMETQEVPVDQQFGDENVDCLLDISKLKNTHVLQRGVTNIENYGLKLTENSSYPKPIVEEAKCLAQIITGQCRKPSGNEPKEAIPTRRDKYLLAQQLLLAAKALKLEDKEVVRRYMKLLRQNFEEKFCQADENSDPV